MKNPYTRIKYLRSIVKNWTQKELAERADITTLTIIRIEKRGDFPNLETRRKLAAVLTDGNIQELFTSNLDEADGIELDRTFPDRGAAVAHSAA